MYLTDYKKPCLTAISASRIIAFLTSLKWPDIFKAVAHFYDFLRRRRKLHSNNNSSIVVKFKDSEILFRNDWACAKGVVWWSDSSRKNEDDLGQLREKL